jgi:NAD(P)-dependent dehydrogenase (short-subunit alcohol dehydrogenase family)
MSDATFRSDIFAGKVALVAGGSSGIGATIGNALARLGARVTVTGANAPRRARREMPPAFPRRAPSRSMCDNAAVAAPAARPRLDILVNCAGDHQTHGRT